MKEARVDLSRATPAYLSTDVCKGAHILITMGCGDECPLIPGVEREDWPVEDPKDQPAERVREIRDDIKKRVAALIRERKWTK
jgi:arsenate reductase